MNIRGSGGSVQVKRFSQADIAGGVDLRVETGSGLPRTRAGRQAQIERWVDMGILPVQKAWKHLDIGDLKGLAAEFQAEEDQAFREIDKIIQGAPINPEQLQQARATLQQGINPVTQMPFQSPEEAQQFITDAAYAPLPWENYDVHITVLAQWMDSPEFEVASPEIRARAIAHFNQTLQAKQNLPVQSEPGKLNTNLQIKATVGPTVAAKMLAKDGVQVTPEEMAEPPLETWVSDSVDKPDADAAGPGQEANQLSEAAAVMIESKTKLADAAVAAQIRKGQDDRSGVESAQKVAHAQELHEEKMRQEQVKTKQLAQPKPAPAGKKG
jgi:hypothetical protein